MRTRPTGRKCHPLPGMPDKQYDMSYRKCLKKGSVTKCAASQISSKEHYKSASEHVEKVCRQTCY